MAKQAGVNPLIGRVGNQIYYIGKNGGPQVRSAYAAQSDRVKNSKEYANTRRCASEFGMVGKFVGGFVRALTQRWRFMIIQNASGMLTKKVYPLLKLDSSIWGQRSLETATASYPNKIQGEISSLSKNEAPSPFIDSITNPSLIYVNSQTHKLEIDGVRIFNPDEVFVLLSKGINNVKIIVSGLCQQTPVWNSQLNQYLFNDVKYRQLDEQDKPLVLEDAVSFSGSLDVEEDFVVSDPGQVSGVMFIVLPCKDDIIMQEDCWFYYTNVALGGGE